MQIDLVLESSYYCEGEMSPYTLISSYVLCQSPLLTTFLLSHLDLQKEKRIVQDLIWRAHEDDTNFHFRTE